MFIFANCISMCLKVNSRQQLTFFSSSFSTIYKLELHTFDKMWSNLLNKHTYLQLMLHMNKLSTFNNGILLYTLTHLQYLIIPTIREIELEKMYK